MVVETTSTSGPLVYVTLTDAELYGLDITDTVAATAILDRAQRDVDVVLTVGAVGSGPQDLKIAPNALLPWQARRLSRATCAQAEYRVEMGAAFFTRDQYEQVGGPDFTTKGRLSWLAPAAVVELYGTGLATGLPAPDGAAAPPVSGPAAGSWTRVTR